MTNAQVSYTSTVPLQITDFSTTLAVPKFNPALGTLTEVDFSVAANSTESGTLQNVAAGSATFTFEEDVEFDVNDGANSLASPTVSSSESYTDLASGATTSYGPFSPSQSASSTYTSGSAFDDFNSGPGNIILNVATTTSQAVTGGGGNIQSVISTEAGATATVTYLYSYTPVTLAGSVYDDKDNSGSLTPSDSPIPGTTLTLLNSSGATVATTTTGPDGSYSFTTATEGSPLPPDTYSIVETQPAGYLQGSNTVGTVNDVTDGTLVPVDKIGSIVLTSGQASVANNFGEVLPVTLSGSVYDDKDNSGSQTPSDTPIPGTTLTLLNASGGVVSTTTTSSDGTYSFTKDSAGNPLPPGTYSIVESQPAGYLQGSNTVGSVNGVTDGTLVPVDQIGSIALTSGQASVTNNFGEVLPVTLSGTVYDDKDNSGSQTPSDTPIPGTTLTLLNSAGAVVATTTTSAAGTYSFTTNTAGNPLPPDTYTIVETQPAGYLQGSNTVGTVNGVTDGTLVPVDQIGSIALTSGQASVTNNFGEVLPVTLSGTVYDDKDNNGSLSPGDTPIPGTTVTLLNSAGTVVATTTTSAAGTYSFTTNSAGNPLPPDTYTIVETQPAGYLQGSNTVGTVNGVTDGTLVPVDQIGSIALTSGQASVTNNFGEVLPVTLSGTVYDDVDHSGTLSYGDQPIPGVTLVLFSPSGEVATTTTNAFGLYSFTDSSSGAPLPPSTYTIVEFQPAGYNQGTDTVGTVNGTPQGVLAAVDILGSIGLNSGQSSIANNFGEVLPAAVPPVPLIVTNVDRFGVHLQPTLVVLTFNTPLDPASAGNVANYRITGPIGSKTASAITILSADVNQATQTVTLHLLQRLDVHASYQLTVDGLTSSTGGVLTGSNGQATNEFSTVLNRSELSGFTDRYGNFVPINHGKLYPTAIAAGYAAKHYVEPANLGAFASANKATFLVATNGAGYHPPTKVKKTKVSVRVPTP